MGQNGRVMSDSKDKVPEMAGEAVTSNSLVRLGFFLLGAIASSLVWLQFFT